MSASLCGHQGMTKLMEEEIQPILVPAVLEHEGISGISGGDKPRSVSGRFRWLLSKLCVEGGI